MDSWKYIVLDLSLNVNGMDTEGMMPNHMLTPLCCAARANCDIEDLVRFSLERNMDAYINYYHGVYDAFGMAESYQELSKNWTAAWIEDGEATGVKG